MATASRRRVVCFDLGGVLVRICSSWAEACTRAALPVRSPELFTSEGWLTRRGQIGARYQLGEIDCNTYFAEIGTALGGLYSPGEVEAIHRAWTFEHYAGALELVRALNAQPRVVTACLSNTNHAHWVRLVGADGRGEYPAVEELQHRLASHLLGCGKPTARIFALALATFAESYPVAPADIIFFDDAAENVRAARAAGWKGFQVDPSADPVQQMRAILTDEGVLP